MKRLAILAAIVVATVVPVAKATSGYWESEGNGYECKGYAKGFICDDLQSGYSVAILPKYVMITRDDKQVIYGCKRNYSRTCVEG